MATKITTAFLASMIEGLKAQVDTHESKWTSLRSWADKVKQTLAALSKRDDYILSELKKLQEELQVERRRVDALTGELQSKEVESKKLDSDFLKNFDLGEFQVDIFQDPGDSRNYWLVIPNSQYKAAEAGAQVLLLSISEAFQKKGHWTRFGVSSRQDWSKGVGYLQVSKTPIGKRAPKPANTTIGDEIPDSVLEVNEDTSTF